MRDGAQRERLDVMSVSRSHLLLQKHHYALVESYRPSKPGTSLLHMDSGLRKRGRPRKAFDGDVSAEVRSERVPAQTAQLTHCRRGESESGELSMHSILERRRMQPL